MAITPSQWSHKLWIPDEYIPGANQSGIQLVVTESVIAKMSLADQDTFWNNVQNGGGDVRFCVNEDGTSQLPVEIPNDNLDNQAKLVLSGRVDLIQALAVSGVSSAKQEKHSQQSQTRLVGMRFGLT